MSKKYFITAITATLLLFISCKKDDDKAFLLLSAVGGGEILKKMPHGVPPSDLVPQPDTTDDSGNLISIVGDSQSPEDYVDPDTTGSGDGSDHPGTTGSGDGSDHPGTTGSGDGSDHPGTTGSGDDSDHPGTTGSGDDSDHSGTTGDEEDDKNSLVRHGKDACSFEGTWYNDANTIFTYEGQKPAGFCFDKVKSGSYDVTIKVKHWVKHDEENASTIPSGYNNFEILISDGKQDAIVMIPVNSSHWISDSVRLQIANPKTEIKVSLQNPFCDNENCVNLQILSVHLRKAQGSDIAASIKNISQNHFPLLISIFILSLIAIIVLSIRNIKIKNI